MSALAAIIVIKTNGKQARVRATVDLVIHQKQDKDLIEARSLVVGLYRNGDTNLAKYLSDLICPEYRAIQATLNNYEFIASGFREAAFDEGIYKRMRYSIWLKDWNALHAFIIEIRTLQKKDTLYQEFERISTRWISSPLKQNKKPWYSFK